MLNHGYSKSLYFQIYISLVIGTCINKSNYEYPILRCILGIHKSYNGYPEKVLWISIDREYIVKRYPHSLRYIFMSHQSFILFCECMSQFELENI